MTTINSCNGGGGSSNKQWQHWQQKSTVLAESAPINSGSSSGNQDLMTMALEMMEDTAFL
eukprot:15364545-Ditylum_brightwellii.AAC.1